MKASALICLGLLLLGSGLAQADPLTASIQQTLKDQGFYYGEITGQKDADTTAAIRRYQIRNGLQITGELSAETQKSLGIKGAAASAPAARPTATPALRTTPPPQTGVQPQPAPYAPGPRGLAPEISGVFDGTPYEVAPPDLQRRVILGA